MSPVDLQVAARALSFLQPPMGGAIRVGIVYAAGNAESEAEAAELQQMMEAGFKTGNVELTPVLVRLSELPTAHVGLYFLTSGLGASAAAVGVASANAHVPCVTIDLSQVQGGTCVMGVRNSPKVEILVNRAAAVHAGIAFSAVFRMMIIEL